MFRSLGLLVTLTAVVAASSYAQRHQFIAGEDKASFRVIAEQTESRTPGFEFEITIPAVEVTRNKDGFSDVRIEGLYPIAKPGTPDLLTTGKIFAVPEGFEPKLQMISEEVRVIPNVVVTPHQKPSRCTNAEIEGFAFERALYESRQMFPKDKLELQEVGKLQDLRLMRVSSNSVRMNMANNSLEVTTRLRAEVIFEKTGTPKVTRLPQSFYQLVGKMVGNAVVMQNYVRPMQGAEKMYIFVADELKNSPSLKTLVNWNRQKGLDLTVKSLKEAGGSKEKIKEYLQKEYDNGVRPTYLLFVGNEKTMPPFYVPAAGSAASEYPFSLLSGKDIIPDVLYGRILADDEAMVAKQVKRWVNYERNPEAGGKWYSQGLSIASDEGSNPSDAEYADRVDKALLTNTYRKVEKYRQKEKNATAANITNTLEAGATWLAYFGHGSGTSWGNTNDKFDTKVVQGLKNTKLPVIIDVACANGNYHKENGFGRAWVTHEVNGESSGALAFYGGTVNISWHPPAIMSEGIAQYHFEKPVYNLGASTMAGQLFLIERLGTGGNVVDNMEWYSLFGDPSLMIRTAAPTMYDVRSYKSGNSYVVKAFNANGPVPGLRVALAMKNRQAVLTGRTGANGIAQLDLKNIGGLDPGTTLTVTGYNADTYVQTIQ